MEPNIIRLTCKEMRAQAREALAGKWTTAVLATLVYFLITSIPTIALMAMDPIIGYLLTLAFGLLVTGPLVAGYFKLSLNIGEHKEAEISNIFEGFNLFGKIVVMSILIGLFTYLWSLLLVIPGIIAMLRYSQAYFILLENPELSPMEAIRRSKQMMIGNKGKLFLLFLSFIGWSILSSITVVGMLWLYPYIFITLAAFYLALKNEQVDESPNKINEISLDK